MYICLCLFGFGNWWSQCYRNWCANFFISVFFVHVGIFSVTRAYRVTLYTVMRCMCVTNSLGMCCFLSPTYLVILLIPHCVYLWTMIPIMCIIIIIIIIVQCTVHMWLWLVIVWSHGWIVAQWQGGSGQLSIKSNQIVYFRQPTVHIKSKDRRYRGTDRVQTNTCIQ